MSSSVIPDEKEINLSIEDAESVPVVTSKKEISMADLLKAQKQIDANNLKAGIIKEPLTRPRSKQKLPLANK